MKIDLVGEKNRGLAMGLNEFAGYFAVGVTAFLTGLIADKYGITPYPFYLGIVIALSGLFLTFFFIKDTQTKYYKISVSDNGMGFDQQFSEKIFILFNRLHLKSDFPGTGIGLSICKKIAENHNGFIIAEGKPGIGATFSVFLPV